MYRIFIACSLLLPYCGRCSDAAFGVVPPLPSPDIVFWAQPQITTTAATPTLPNRPDQFAFHMISLQTQMMAHTIDMAHSDDYTMRAQQFGITSDKSIRAALQQVGTIVLDVRSTEEISKTGRLPDLTVFPSDRLIYIQSDCSPTDCSTLRTSPQDVIPNFATSTSTIVVHCATGRRAALAKEFLTENGYKGTILNAGSYDDVQRFFHSK